MADFRKNIKLTKKIGSQEYIEITTEIHNSIVLSVQELLKEEKTFAETYKYNLSDLYKYFMKNKKGKKTLTKSKKKSLPKTKKKTNRCLF